MKHFGLLQTAACAALFLAGLPQRAVSSDQWLKTTIIDFSSPIRVPGKTLPAGKYTFKLVQSPAMQLQVQIFNETQSRILATVNTNPIFRMTPPDNTTIIFYEAPVGQPEPIKAWLYPGDQYGREFIYGKSEALLIAKAARETNSTAVAQIITPAAPVQAEVTEEKVIESPLVAVESPAAAPIVAEPAPRPEPEPTAAIVAEPAPETPAPEPLTMPSTGSELPLVGLIGLLSLTAAAAIRIRNAS
jgi:hypothetical protein